MMVYRPKSQWPCQRVYTLLCAVPTLKLTPPPIWSIWRPPIFCLSRNTLHVYRFQARPPWALMFIWDLHQPIDVQPRTILHVCVDYKIVVCMTSELTLSPADSMCTVRNIFCPRCGAVTRQKVQPCSPIYAVATCPRTVTLPTPPQPVSCHGCV